MFINKNRAFFATVFVIQVSVKVQLFFAEFVSDCLLRCITRFSF